MATTLTFEPRTTREWSTNELEALVGKYVAINISGTEHAGNVQRAGIDRHGFPYIDFSYPDRTSIWWNRDTDEVTISVTYEGGMQ